MNETARLRRGLGVLYLLSALAHGAIMAFAALYAQGRIPWVVPAAAWSRLYFLHFLVTVGGGGLYLFLSFWRSKRFHAQLVSDFGVGIASFMLVMTLWAALLVKRVVPPWTSFVPSAFLLAYGLGLLWDRRMGFGPRDPGQP